MTDYTLTELDMLIDVEMAEYCEDGNREHLEEALYYKEEMDYALNHK